MAGSYLLSQCSEEAIRLFPGSAAGQPDDDLKQNFGAVEAKNCQFGPGWVESRTGFGVAWTPAGAQVLSMFDWESQSLASRLIYLTAAGKLISRDLPSGTEVELLDLATLGLGTLPTGISGAAYGRRVLISFHGGSSTEVRVWDGNNTSGVQNVDKAFQGPFRDTYITLITAPVAVLPGEVALTAGVHRVAAVFTTRNGHFTGLSPVGAIRELVPFEFTANGTNAYTLQVTPVSAWPAWVGKMRVALTDKTNLLRYYYPENNDAVQVAVGTTTPVTVRIAINDATLIIGGDSSAITNIREKVSTDGAGNGEIFPYAIAKSQSRVAYVATVTDELANTQSAVFASDQEDPQYITYDQHMIQLPAFLPISAIRFNGKYLFMFGQNWTYMRFDNGDKPVLWPPTEAISESTDSTAGIGTKFVHGALVTSSGLVLVAHESGLHVIQGANYRERPITWSQGRQEWAQINWAAGQNELEIKEDVKRRLILVKCPLGTATKASHILTWDYTNDLTPEGVRFSGWTIGAGGGSAWDVGGFEMVTHPTTKGTELWVGRATTNGAVLRQRNPSYPSDVGNLANDGGFGFEAKYTTSVVGLQENKRDWIAAQMEATGSGIAKLWMRMKSGARSVALRDVTLNSGGDIVERISPGSQSESCALTISNNGVVDASWRLSLVKLWWKVWLQ